jgi:tRNA-modifying protein YgfZ
MIVDQTSWGHIKVTGVDRIRFMQGMCTANIETLAPGDWTRACMLDAKGRVTSVIEVMHRDDHLLLICQPELTDKTLGLLTRYAIMDDVEFEAVDLAVHRVWNSPADVWDAPPVLSSPPRASASADQIEIRRVEAGMPRYGADVSEDYFPFESPLARHIDYQKGCYLGQEPVSRVHFRGAPNKALRGLRIEGEGPVEPGAQVSHAERPGAGVITSAVVSPDFGPIALAYIHRSVNQPGNQVTVAGRAATVVELPFGSISGQAAG